MTRPKTPLLTVDCVLFDEQRRVLLIIRKNPPFEGMFALPGGFVDIGETVEDACRRELKEETGLTADELTLVGVYSNPDRDPRGHTCSIVFAGRIAGRLPQPGDDAARAEWIGDWRNAKLAFDHRKILEDAERIILSATAGHHERG